MTNTLIFLPTRKFIKLKDEGADILKEISGRGREGLTRKINNNNLLAANKQLAEVSVVGPRCLPDSTCGSQMFGW